MKNINNLVERFANALEEKLFAAEAKYGHNDGWMRDNWMDECREQLLEHVAKGDPVDVAAYCAFLWHHKQTTCSATVNVIIPGNPTCMYVAKWDTRRRAYVALDEWSILKMRSER